MKVPGSTPISLTEVLCSFPLGKCLGIMQIRLRPIESAPFLFTMYREFNRKPNPHSRQAQRPYISAYSTYNVCNLPRVAVDAGNGLLKFSVLFNFEGTEAPGKLILNFLRHFP
jgi:hypothetical protein